MEEKQMLKRRKNRNAYVIVSAVMILVVITTIMKAAFSASQKSEPEIISEATLEKIINVSELSTFEAIYNGIAKVMNGKKPEKIDYYVSYDAKVKAGIDFDKIEVVVDYDNKIITVIIPEIKINDVNVDIASLDYIFENEKANTPTVSEEAYKKCIEDARNESNSTDAIYEIARQNAHNIIEALIRPFIEQLDAEYQLQIN